MSRGSLVLVVFRQPTPKIDLDVDRHQPIQKIAIFYII
jgi:hypothetical protein